MKIISIIYHGKQEVVFKTSKSHTDFQPSGSKQAVILVLIPGNGPGSRVTFPPTSLIASAVLYTSSVPTAICHDFRGKINYINKGLQNVVIGERERLRGIKAHNF